MKLKIEIDMDGLAFFEKDYEVCLVLQRIIDAIKADTGDTEEIKVVDSNGNICGYCEVDTSEE